MVDVAAGGKETAITFHDVQHLPAPIPQTEHFQKSVGIVIQFLTLRRLCMSHARRTT